MIKEILAEVKHSCSTSYLKTDYRESRSVNITDSAGPVWEYNLISKDRTSGSEVTSEKLARIMPQNLLFES